MIKNSYKKNLYIVEGKIEKKFIEELKTHNLIKLGKCAEFNLMQKKIKKTNNIMSKTYNEIFGIIDTDCVEDCNLQNLYDNIKFLRSVGKVKVFVQCRNFEEELAYILELKSSDIILSLCKYLELKNKTKDDLKDFLAKNIIYIKYINEENLKKYCSRPEAFEKLLKEKINIVNGINLLVR